MDVDREIADLENLRRNLIDRIARSDAHFKHQQRNEPDLSLSEKYQIADGILKTNVVLFLSRFGSYILSEDLPYFADHRNSYEVQFYLTQIERQHDNVFKKKLVNNRRYAAMQELMMGGEYFSEEEMKWRDPWLYNEMVGQYLSEDEIKAKVDKSDLRFSSVLLKHMDQLRENAWFEVLKEKEEGQIEESESDDEDKEEKEDKVTDSSEESKPKISETEKNILRSEFLQIMQERFLTGNDKTFDYSKVDKNSCYDNLESLGKDEEERYFDDDDDDDDDDDGSCMVSEQDRSPIGDVDGSCTVVEQDRSEIGGVDGSCMVVEQDRNEMGDVEDYMRYRCEPVCETRTLEQLGNMTVSTIHSSSTDDDNIEHDVPGTDIQTDPCNIKPNVPGTNIQTDPCNIETDVPGTNIQTDPCNIETDVPGTDIQTDPCNIETDVPGTDIQMDPCNIKPNVPSNDIQTENCSGGIVK